MDAAVEKTPKIPPYASFVSFENLVEWLGSMDVMPAQLDRSLWQSKFSGATGSALISAARFLDLIENERPTPMLIELVQADKEARGPLIEKILRSAYGNEIVDQAATMTPRMFDEHLRGLGTTEATHRKAASFLTNALKAADVSVQPAIAKRARNRRPGSSRRASSQKNAQNTQSSASEPQAGAETAATSTPIGARNERKLTLQEGQTVSLVIESDMLSLPADDLEWVLSVVRMFDEYASERDRESDAVADDENEEVTDDENEEVTDD